MDSLSDLKRNFFAEALNYTTEEAASLTNADLEREYYLSGGSGGGAVDSVNGKTGEVTLNAVDVGARPDDWTPDVEDIPALPYRPDDWTPDLSGYVPLAQFNALVARVEALENPETP